MKLILNAFSLYFVIGHSVFDIDSNAPQPPDHGLLTTDYGFPTLELLQVFYLFTRSSFTEGGAVLPVS